MHGTENVKYKIFSPFHDIITELDCIYFMDFVHKTAFKKIQEIITGFGVRIGFLFSR
jgi:hypothetical protein